MPLLWFNLSECGTLIADEEGREVLDLDAAWAIALTAARDIMAAEVKEGRLCLSCRIDITDEAGSIVATVPFSDAVTITGRSV